MTINYLILIAGMFFGTLTLLASINAQKNNVEHSRKGSALIHLASTISMYALMAWGIITLSWWSPFLVLAALFLILRFVVTEASWSKYFRAIPITGGLTTAITCGAWLKWAFV